MQVRGQQFTVAFLLTLLAVLWVINSFMGFFTSRSDQIKNLDFENRSMALGDSALMAAQVSRGIDFELRGASCEDEEMNLIADPRIKKLRDKCPGVIFILPRFDGPVMSPIATNYTEPLK